MLWDFLGSVGGRKSSLKDLGPEASCGQVGEVPQGQQALMEGSNST